MKLATVANRTLLESRENKQTFFVPQRMSETSALTTGPNSNFLWQNHYSANGREQKKVNRAFLSFSEALVLVGLWLGDQITQISDKTWI